MTAVATVDRAPLTAVLLDALQTALVGGLDGEVAVTPLNSKDISRYFILYPIEGGGFTGPPQLPESDATLCYQVTSVASRGDQLEALGDLVRRTMLTANIDAALATAGLALMGRWSESAGGIDSDTTLLSLPERFYFSVTSS